MAESEDGGSPVREVADQADNEQASERGEHSSESPKPGRRVHFTKEVEVQAMVQKVQDVGPIKRQASAMAAARR